MATIIRGTAQFDIDFKVDEDLTDLEAEEAFNQAVLDTYFNGAGYSEFGFSDYDQEHEFNA